MERKKTKLTISGSSKKTMRSIEIAKTQGKNSVLIQKKTKVRTPQETFRVLAEKNTDFWLEAGFNTFKEAKDFIDKISTSDINYYIHNENNRVLYTKEGI